MEKPYKGRAVLQDNLTHLQIIIPAKQSLVVIVFLSLWLSVWLPGGLSIIVLVVNMITGSPYSLFQLLWFVIWAGGSFFALQALLWNVAGKEIITVGQGTLRIAKKGTLLHRLKVYDLNEIKNIRVKEHDDSNGIYVDRRRTNVGPYGNGIIWFDYGLQTVKFASGIDKAEAIFIVNQLKNRSLFTEKNYS